MYSKVWLPLLAFILLFRACTPGRSAAPTSRPKDPRASVQSGQDPNAPVKNDESLKEGTVKIDSLAIVVSASYPPYYQLDVKGTLPTPCHQLRTLVGKPDVESAIHVQIYSVYDPYTVCAPSQSPFDVSLALGGYVRGSYTVIVNDQEVGEIVP